MNSNEQLQREVRNHTKSLRFGGAILSWSAILATALLLAVPQEAAAQRTRQPSTLCCEDPDRLLRTPTLESKNREVLLERMGLRDGQVVADVGAGVGAHSLEIAKRIAPHGVVFAEDFQEKMLVRLRERMVEAGIKNIYPVLGTVDDPYLPPGKVDWILLMDVYHEMPQPEPMLEQMRRSLAPGGRVALVEFRAEQRMEGIWPRPITPVTRGHFMSIDQVLPEWTAAGFVLEDRGEFLPDQHVFIFKAAGDQVEGTWRGGGAIKTLSVGSTPNVSTFGEDVYFAGQPTPEDLEQFREMGITAVINLRTEQETKALGFDEQALLKEAGVRYLHAPMRGEFPGQEQLDSIFELLDRTATRKEGVHEKVLMHCASANRVAAVWALYRGTYHGLPADEVLEESRVVGLKSAALEQELKNRLQ